MGKQLAQRVPAVGAKAPSEGDSVARWLASSALMNLRDGALVLRARLLARDRRSDRERAVAIHDFVRSLPLTLRFRYRARTASEVLRHGGGDAVDKATLLVALLRLAGFPARVMFARPLPEALQGLPADVSSYPRPIVEVQVEGRWLRTDAFIFDDEYLRAAQYRLRNKREAFGYGVAAASASAWNGARDAYVLGQDHEDELESQTIRPYSDAVEFSRSLGLMRRVKFTARFWLWNIRSGDVERTVRALRSRQPRPPKQSRRAANASNASLGRA